MVQNDIVPKQKTNDIWSKAPYKLLKIKVLHDAIEEPLTTEEP